MTIKTQSQFRICNPADDGTSEDDDLWLLHYSVWTDTQTDTQVWQLGGKLDSHVIQMGRKYLSLAKYLRIV